jgi:hypothetical protein
MITLLLFKKRTIPTLNDNKYNKYNIYNIYNKYNNIKIIIFVKGFKKKMN